MASVLDEFLRELATGDTIHDYQHAARIYVDGVLRRSPKYAFLFYVKFTINQGNDTPKSLQLKTSDVADIGALAKSANLPRFTMDTKVYNAYNRPNIVQSKIKYDPVTIKFHDDSSSLVREFWYDYLSYFYRDTDYTDPIYDSEHKYVPRQRENWGYTLKPDAANPGNGYNKPAKTNLLQSISIYSMSQKQFHEYQLINPVITQFQHGEHNMAEGSGTLEHAMTVQYETLHYRKGPINSETMSEFLLHYDKTPSPLSPAGGGTRSLLGPGGLFNSLNSISADLAAGNFLAAAITAARTKQNFQGTTLGAVAQAEGSDLINTAIRSGQNPFSSISVPSVSDAAALAGLVGLATGAIGTTNQNTSGGAPATSALVGSTPAVGVSNTVSVAGASSIRDSSANIPTTLASSNGVTVSAPINPILGTQISGFPTLTSTVAGTSSQFVVPAAGDPIASLNNAGEVVSGASQGTPV